MDIVSRLKTFINYAEVPVTQFADNCRIPRPTLSQLLNGRNKKVSDELIGKIHEAYPQLSVLWLMFGEGDMLHGANIKTSEPQQGDLFDFSSPQHADTETSAPRLDFGDTFQNSDASEIETERTDAPAISSMPIDVNKERLSKDVLETRTTLSFNSDQEKKIVNIIVYYNDNSFESFIPSPDKK